MDFKCVDSVTLRIFIVCTYYFGRNTQVYTTGSL